MKKILIIGLDCLGKTIEESCCTQELYAVDDNVPSLSLFTARFGRRMVEMADDVDMSVAISAIGLLKQLLRLVDAICLFCFLNVVISYVFDC
jgi:hypothetical protein